MNAAILPAAGISVLAVFFFLLESESLSEGHARVRTQVLNAARWAFVIALAWVLIPVALSQSGPQRAPTIVGLVALVGAFLLVPVRWFVRVGGRQPTWELRRVKIETTQLANKIRRDPTAVAPADITTVIGKIEALRTPETVELCDLIVAELVDLMRGVESWNVAGRRTIRIDELSRRLWPGAMPPPDHDPTEATFRWRLYRTFGELMEAGVAGLPRASRTQFRCLLRSLGAFRRPDTAAFIADAIRSGNRWLAESSADRPWIEALDFSVLGPDGLDEVKQIWGRDAALWGAELDDADRRAIEADLKPAQPSQAQSRKAQPEGEL